MTEATWTRRVRRTRIGYHHSMALVHIWLVICALLTVFAGVTTGTELPAVNVTHVRRVFHNGEHNAFTDLVRFQGLFYLTFRSCPDGHMVHPTASIIVLRSEDARKWEQVHRFGVTHRDTRDPHFLVFHDRLFVYTGTWYSGATTIPIAEYDLNKHLGYAAWSDDGSNWHSPIMLEGTFGHYIWRANTFGGKAYLCGRRKTEFDIAPRGEGRQVESLMLESDDGLIWRKRAVFQEDRGDETAFQFEPDGSLIAIGRCGSQKAQLLAAPLPPTPNGSALTWIATSAVRCSPGGAIAMWSGGASLHPTVVPKRQCAGWWTISYRNLPNCPVAVIIPIPDSSN